MKRKKNFWSGLARKGAVAAVLLGTSGWAAADPFGIQLGTGIARNHLRDVDLVFAWDPGLTWWPVGDWHFALVGEANVSWWHTNEGNVHDNIGEIGVTPIVRFIKGTGAIRPYIEAGAGVRLLTSPTIASSFNVATAFQFAELVGIGAQFGNRQQYQAGVRFQHVSNGGIKEPNPGINFSQLYLQYNF